MACALFHLVLSEPHWMNQGITIMKSLDQSSSEVQENGFRGKVKRSLFIVYSGVQLILPSTCPRLQTSSHAVLINPILYE